MWHRVPSSGWSVLPATLHRLTFKVQGNVSSSAPSVSCLLQSRGVDFLRHTSFITYKKQLIRFHPKDWTHKYAEMSLQKTMCSFRKDVWQLTVAWHGSFGLFQSHIGGLTNGPDVSSWISLTKTKETPTNFKRNNMFIYWRGGGRERNINMREKHQLVVSHTLSYHGSNQQPRYVP